MDTAGLYARSLAWLGVTGPEQTRRQVCVCELFHASYHLVRLIPWPSILHTSGEATLRMDTAGLYARSLARWAVKGPEQTRGQVRV